MDELYGVKAYSPGAANLLQKTGQNDRPGTPVSTMPPEKVLDELSHGRGSAVMNKMLPGSRLRQRGRRRVGIGKSLFLFPTVKRP